MKKNSSLNQRVLWLLLLLAVECAQMSYGATVTYTVSSTTTVSKSSGKAPFGGTATYSQGAATAGQITKDNTSRLTLSDWGETSISNISLSMCSNASAGSGKLRYSTDGGTTWSYIVGSAGAGVAFNNSAWNGSYTTSYKNISKNVSITGDEDYDIIIEIVGTKNSLYCQSFTITHDGDICEIFDETFCASTGTNVSFGGTTGDANGTLYTDNASWTLANQAGAAGSAKFGGSSKKGSATTPGISVTSGNDYTLKFFAAPWNTESATMTVTLTGGTISGNSSATTSTMTTGKWNYYEYTVRATSSTLSIAFTASKNRFFLDDVCLCNAAVTCANPTALTKGSISLSDRTAQVQPINWTSAAGKVDICYSTNSSKPGATPGSGYTVVSNITSSPYNLNITSFAAGNYYVWARSVCDESTKSDWIAITGSYFTVPGHTLTISADPDGSGTFSKSPDISTVVENRQVAITASPAAGYTFTSWAVSGTSSTLSSTSTNPTTFTMGTANATVTGTFTAKEVTGWTWKQQSTGETEITIPDVVDLYVGQQAWFNLKSYTPADVIAEKKGYSSSYTNTYLAEDNKAGTYYKTRAKAVIASTTLTLTSSSNSSVTQEITIRITALPSVTFTDIIHGETFGAVTATVDATDKRVVYTTKKTPTHDDLDEPGSGNDCEKQHLHLAGWILKDWADLHPDATSSEISGAGSGNFYSTNADIDLVAKNGKTFYAVWSKLE